MATPKKTPPPGGSIRAVGPLALFGIKDMWRVPMILPKEYWDYSNPDIALTDLKPGSFACVGGDAIECQLVTPGGEAVVAMLAEDYEAECDEASHLLSDTETESDSDVQDSSPAADGGMAAPQDAEESEEFSEQDDAFEETGLGSSSIERWSFVLVGSNSTARLRVEIDALTKAHKETITLARNGDGLYVYGLIEQVDGGLVMRSAEPVEESSIGIIHARYPSKSKKVLQPVTMKARKRGTKVRRKPKWVIHKLTPDNVASLIRERLQYATRKFGVAIRERLGITSKRSEWDLLRKFDSPAINFEGLIHQAHYPRSIVDGKRAIRALERLSALEVMIEVERDRVSQRDESSRIRCTAAAYKTANDELFANSGIRMSPEQDFACREILADLASNVRQHRILSGDVGTGKTIVFGVAAATIYASRKLTVILEPRSSLAAQVHRKLSSYWPNIPMMLITGETKELNLPTAGIIVGTTGVWSRLEKTGIKPDWIIADEQQKFGTTQRQPWVHSDTNTLEATATPIPRTQGLVGLEGISVSTLSQCHTEKHIETVLVQGDFELEHAYEEVIERVRLHDANLILVFPLVDKREDDEPTSGPPASIAEAKARWAREFGKDVAIIHGRIDDIDKSGVLADFENRTVNILIATIILEVGIDFTKATQMIIHHPERLGVAAIHQLRGRLARQGGDGWCYLAVGSDINEGSLAMMQHMTIENDGFKLAERDMERRGYGDLRKHANQQSGAYAGILVDREPQFCDLTMVQTECKRWISGETISVSLFGDGNSDRTAMAAIGKLVSKAKSPKIDTIPPPTTSVPKQLQMF